MKKGLIILITSLIATTLVAGEFEGWQIIKKSINIENNSYFPLKITYKKGTKEKTKYLPIDFGTADHGPIISIKSPEKIRGNINISIAMPYKFEKIQDWLQWIDQQSPIKLGTIATSWTQHILEALPQKDAVASILQNLHDFSITIDPTKYEKQGAIVHIFWPLIQAAMLKGPWIFALEPNSTTEHVWQALRRKTGGLIQYTQQKGIQTYNLLKSWITYDLQNLIRSNKINEYSTVTDIEKELPAIVKTFDGWEKHKIFEDYIPNK